MHMLRLCTLLGFLLIVGVSLCFGTTRLVPAQYPTIQEAIVASVDADVVLVSPGTYHEHLDFLGKDVLVTSTYTVGADCSLILTTIIDADSIGSAVVMSNGESPQAVLMGFTIRNGAGHLYEPGYGAFYVGGGVYLINASPTIKFNVITGNHTRDGGGGLFSDGGNPFIHRNTIVENYTTIAGCGAGLLLKNSTGGLVDSNYVQFNYALHGGGIALKHSNAAIARNVISNNVATADGGGIRIYTQSAPAIINNTISHNDGEGNGGGVQVLEESAPVFMNNIISYTAAGGGFLATPGCNPVLSYNLFFENAGGDYIGVLPGVGDLSGDPLYVSGNPYDYHLTPLSQAINHGNPSLSYNDPDGTRNDCGAFYYSFGPATPVVLASFSGSASPEGVTLHWTTASEIECWAWVVQRLHDGCYQDVSSLIPGYGTSVEPHDYTYVDESAQPGNTYTYRLKEIDLDGSITYSNPVSVSIGMTALAYRLNQNFPNPFNPQTTIAYELAQAGPVTLAIYDPAGRLVKELVSGYQEAGSHTALWNAFGLPSGIYLCRMQAGGQIFNRPLALVK